MRSFLKFFLSGTTIFTLSGTAFADAFSLVTDNDFFGGWSDKYYTNHTRFSYTLNGDFDESDYDGALYFSFGQEMYAPKDRYAAPPPIKDHPYAGFLYLSVGRADWDENFLLSIEGQIGVVGPSAMAHGVQDVYHDLIHVKKLSGWEYQVQNQLGANFLSESRFRTLFAGTLENGFAADLISRGFFELGTVRTLISGGTQLRFGYNLPANFGVSPMRQSTSVIIPTKQPFAAYAFWDFQGDIVVYDVTLGGQFLRHFDYADIEKRTFVFQSTVGFEIVYGSWTFTFYQSFRTRDFYSQDHTFSAWGGIKFSYSW